MNRRKQAMNFACAVGAAGLFLAGASAFGNSAKTRSVARQKTEDKRPAPVRITAQFISRAKNPKIPWQFYGHYAEIYNGFAARIEAVVTEKTPKAKAKTLRAAVDYYKDLAERVRAMGELRKTMDGIRHHNTDIPPLRWGETYKGSKIKHRKQLTEFVQVAKSLPFKGALPKEVNAQKPE